jgi:hypothetical protein
MPQPDGGQQVWRMSRIEARRETAGYATVPCAVARAALLSRPFCLRLWLALTGFEVMSHTSLDKTSD